jgi:hypothetical protein
VPKCPSPRLFRRASGFFGACVVLVAFNQSTAGPQPMPSPVGAADPVPAVTGPAPGMSHAEYAAADPIGFARWARQEFEKRVTDYRCTFTKQELVQGKMTKLQVMELRYRHNPEAIYMIWKENEDEVRRALYIPGDPAYREPDGTRLARVEPAGAIARLFVSDIMIEIDGDRAKKASRRTIADAGLRGTYRLLEEYNGAAERNGELDFRYIGPSSVAGRATYRFERFVPVSKVDGKTYIDARMIFHIDQEHFYPVAVYSFADHEGKKLLGQYLFSNVEINPRFTADDFKF